LYYEKVTDCGSAVYCNEHVCVSVHSHISETTCPDFAKFSAYVTYGRGVAICFVYNDVPSIIPAPCIVWVHELQFDWLKSNRDKSRLSCFIMLMCGELCRERSSDWEKGRWNGRWKGVNARTAMVGDREWKRGVIISL